MLAQQRGQGGLQLVSTVVDLPVSSSPEHCRIEPSHTCTAGLNVYRSLTNYERVSPRMASMDSTRAKPMRLAIQDLLNP